MRRRTMLTALSAGATAALTGCTSDPSGGQETTTEPTTAGDTDATVQARSTDEYGDILADAEGMSLYLFDQDEGGESTCYDDCAQNWPPLTMDGDPTATAAVTVDLGTTEHDDDSTQVTAAGWPLYYFSGDGEPGDTNGQGVDDVWWLLAPDGARVTAAGGTTTATTTTDGDGPY